MVSAIISGLAAIIVAWLFGRFSGAAKERERTNSERNKTISKIGESNEKLAKMDDRSIRNELAKWVRNKND